MFLCPPKEKIFMSPPHVSCLVAVATPQQKEACVWGPVAGRRGGQGRRGFTYTARSSLDEEEEEREASQRAKQAGTVSPARSLAVPLLPPLKQQPADEPELTGKRSG